MSFAPGSSWHRPVQTCLKSCFLYVSTNLSSIVNTRAVDDNLRWHLPLHPLPCANPLFLPFWAYLPRAVNCGLQEQGIVLVCFSLPFAPVARVSWFIENNTTAPTNHLCLADAIFLQQKMSGRSRSRG